MAKCEVCGNDYHLAFQVVTASETHTFDCFECAVQKLAPVCDYCGVRVTGRGVEKSGAFYCGATCARAAGATQAHERSSETPPIGVKSEERIEAMIDRDNEWTFPASDPPGWVLGVERDDSYGEGENEGGASTAALTSGIGA